MLIGSALHHGRISVVRFVRLHREPYTDVLNQMGIHIPNFIDVSVVTITFKVIFYHEIGAVKNERSLYR